MEEDEEEDKEKEEKKRKNGNGGRVPQNHVGSMRWATERQAAMDGNVQQRKREKVVIPNCNSILFKQLYFLNGSDRTALGLEQ